MGFKLLEDRVAIIAEEVKETTESGLVLLPDSAAQEPIRYGTVHAVGEGHKSDYTGVCVYPGVNPGDRVFFNRHSGSTLEIEGTEYLFLDKREIIGIADD